MWACHTWNTAGFPGEPGPTLESTDFGLGMRQSFAILAATCIVLLATTLILGYILGPGSGGAAPDPRSAAFAKHSIAAVITLLFCGFVHVIGFTYFVVCGRMAADAVERAGLDRRGYEEISTLKRRALRWLLFGVGSALAAGISGAMEWSSMAPSRGWHFFLAHAALLMNAWAFVMEYGLIGQNVRVTERIYAQLDSPSATENPPTGDAAR